MNGRVAQFPLYLDHLSATDMLCYVVYTRDIPQDKKDSPVFAVSSIQFRPAPCARSAQIWNCWSDTVRCPRHGDCGRAVEWWYCRSSDYCQEEEKKRKKISKGKRLVLERRIRRQQQPAQVYHSHSKNWVICGWEASTCNIKDCIPPTVKWGYFEYGESIKISCCNYYSINMVCFLSPYLNYELISSSYYMRLQL